MPTSSIMLSKSKAGLRTSGDSLFPYLPYYLIGLIFLQTAFGLIELSHPDNSIPVNRFVTPLHIVPEWYFLAYYAVLKVIPSKTGGLLVFMLSTCQ
ncbi:putative apocytochrome b [Besnoitia besnoiti]|uniref:Cytochrome b n=1 Tax=Besnoitia besnoiti TaxID=94643 RepID=A0A2A9M4T1_BESBE|nr:putative apocytochrome b [Besnoitia besnoiti]XP_029214665.1 putative apocytochrome b [Besnoitia besnoiti]PFH30639.1 putative apocytochrome b [Besnoitia besnoiti]PFH30653.1 putative apocytochrome b [Besnoitia besnoiti]